MKSLKVSDMNGADVRAVSTQRWCSTKENYDAQIDRVKRFHDLGIWSDMQVVHLHRYGNDCNGQCVVVDPREE